MLALLDIQGFVLSLALLGDLDCANGLVRLAAHPCARQRFGTVSVGTLSLPDLEVEWSTGSGGDLRR